MNFLTKALFAATLALGAPGLAAAQACPSYENPGATLEYSAEDVWVPQSSTVIAGGDLVLADCPSVPGVGHIISSPDFSLIYDGLGMGRALEFRVTGDCDTVLLVNTANAEWLFNDDDAQMHPRLRVEGAPDGRYDIWVGTFDATTCAATLTIESF
ncbi:hypothetical protein [Pararhodobacter sp.]|uniref:hypothetical protein n=1 Tax=Pararhodobacter sp. TaxID=2127056 RepID=UPI002AFFD58B|nr:hypothetical protein [Pararhodobacter sp.]